MMMGTVQLSMFVLLLLAKITLIHSSKDPYDVKNSCVIFTHGRGVADVVIDPFIVFTYVIPDDVFHGTNDHTISISETSSSNLNHTCGWYTFDSTTRIFTALADQYILDEQPIHGYTFEVKTKSICDSQIISTSFTIRIRNDKTVAPCLTIQLEVEMKEVNNCPIIALLDIIHKSEIYLTQETSTSLVPDYTKTSFGFDRRLKFTLAFKNHVTKCTESCDQSNLQHLASKIISEFGVINDQFSQLLQPKYIVFSAYSDAICPQKPTDLPHISHKPSLCIKPTVFRGMQDTSIPAYQSTQIHIPDNVFYERNLVFSLQLTDKTNHAHCWFYVEGTKVHFLPINNTVAKQPHHGYTFLLTGTKVCGASFSIGFRVKITTKFDPPCFLFEASIYRTKVTCELQHVEKFKNIVLQNIQTSRSSAVKIHSFHIKTGQVLTIIFTVWDEERDCSHCTRHNVNEIKDILTNNKKFANHLPHLQHIKLLSDCLCGKQQLENNHKSVIFNARIGTINKFILPPRNHHGYELPTQPNDNICFINEKNQQVIIFLSQSGDKHNAFEINLKTRSSVCVGDRREVPLQIHSLSLKYPPCYSISLRFTTTHPSKCILQSIDEMMNVLSKYFHVPYHQIIIVNHSLKKVQNTKLHVPTTQIQLQLTFSEQCLKCSSILLQSYVHQMINHNIKDQKTDFQKLIQGRFELFNVTYTACIDGSDRIVGILHTSSSFIPIWIYLLPVFFALLVLLILFMACCCCCRTRVSLCCCKKRKREVHRVSSSSYPSSSIHSLERAYPAASKNYRDVTLLNTSTNDTTKVVSNKEKNVTSTEHTNTMIGGVTTTKEAKGVAVANGNTIYATIDNSKNASATASNFQSANHNERNVSHAASNLQSINHNERNVSRECVSNHAYDPVTVLPTNRDTISHTNRTTHQSNHTRNQSEERRMHSILNDRNRSNRSSRRVRSYSDGFLLDEGLDLPIPPRDIENENMEEEKIVRTHSRRVFHHLKTTRSDDDMLLGRRRIVVPIKLTARVKSISKSYDDGLNTTFRPSYIRFQGQKYECEQPDQSLVMCKTTPQSNVRVRFKMASSKEPITSTVGKTSQFEMKSEKWKDDRRSAYNPNDFIDKDISDMYTQQKSGGYHNKKVSKYPWQRDGVTHTKFRSSDHNNYVRVIHDTETSEV